MSAAFEDVLDVLRNSSLFSDKDIQTMENVSALPTLSEIEEFSFEPEVSSILESLDNDHDRLQEELNKLAFTFYQQNEIDKAWKVLLQQF